MTNPKLNPAALEGPDLLAGIPNGEPWAVNIQIGSERLILSIDRNSIEVRSEVGINARSDFSFTFTEDEWAKFTAGQPGRGFNSPQAYVATQGHEHVIGDRTVWARNTAALDRILNALRDQQRAADSTKAAERLSYPDAEPGISPIVGRYLNTVVGGQKRRIYFETAGTGTPILCLHTAGSDSRQFRYLLEDEKLTANYQVVAFDLPRHGRSAPEDNWADSDYRLTTAAYAETILAVIDGLNLDKPILMGCSMGGAIALYMASKYGDHFTGVIALEGGLGNPGRFVDWTNRTDVDHSSFLASWVSGLISPTSPVGPAAQTLWGYASNGPGVYQGDTFFYSQDLPREAANLEPVTIPLFVLSGEYDYSATTEMSQAAVDRVGGELVVMEGMGHFPMSEDPTRFAGHLFSVLEKLGSSQLAR